MARRNVLALIVILAIFTLAICALVFPVLGREGIRLGLDLVGGSHLVYQAKFSENATGAEKARAMDRALATIRSRIDKYGVTEPIIQKQEGGRILVQLPGFTDIEAAKSLVEETGYLEFREVELNRENEPVYLSDYLESSQPTFFDKEEDGARIFVDEDGNPIAFLVKDEAGDLKYTDEMGNAIDAEELRQMEIQLTAQLEPDSAAPLSWMPARGDDGTQLIGEYLDKSTPLPDERAGIVQSMKIGFAWNAEGGEIFDQIAKRLYARPYQSAQRSIGIFLDNVLISAPHIEEPVYQGRGEITSPRGFSIEGANRLANLFESGALPMPVEKPPLYQQKVSSILGADFIDMSVKAGVIGIILVMLFMIVYYRLSGVLASLSLVFYGVLVMALFKLIPVTLTLAGLGGFILSIGMAVDANVLIFERMKEEFRTGRALGATIETGFNRAWTAIKDSNITTFIVCAILYWLGSNIVASAPVMGFALTLFIGVAVSMFTAIVVTRTLLRLFVGTRLARRAWLFSVYAGRDNV